MIASAVLALLSAWGVQYADSRVLLALPVVAWPATALLAWVLLGARPALVLLVVGWTLVRADWLLERHHPPALAGRDVVVTGVVCDFAREDADATRFLLCIDDGGPGALPERCVHLGWYEDAPPVRPGQRWQLLLRLRPPRGLANPGAFDFEHWLYVRGIGATGYVRRSPLNRPLPASARDCPVGRMRDGLVQRVKAALGNHPALGYVLGVVAGATHRLEDDDWELMRATGTTHLLAISGLNIAMVAAPWLWFMQMLGRLWPPLAGRRSLGLLIGLAVAVLYSALSGFAVATVRALVMLAAATALALLRRQAALPELLAAAVLAQLALDPAAVTSAGFALSFAGVAWLMLLSRPPPGGQRPSRAWVRSGLQLGEAQFVLGLGLAPLSLAWFQQLSLIAPLTNLLAVPVFTLLVMPLALAGSALLYLCPGAAAWLLRASADVVGQLMSVLALVAGSGLAIWRSAAVSWDALLLAATAALLLCWWRPLPWRGCALLLMLPIVCGVRAPRVQLAVTVMDVGQGLAVLVRTPNHALLYDAGPAFRRRDAGESVVEPVLRRLGLHHLDVLMLSHDDQDHAGGAASVLRAFPTGVLVAPRPPAPGVAARFRQCEQGLAWTWDGVRFRVLSPPAGDRWASDNDGSCVLWIEAPAASVLLPGDIGRAREMALGAAGALQRADLVLAPHHGSRSSSGDALVGALRARFVVFSAGHRNRWGFPAPEVRQRWAAGGACLLDTAASGALTFVTDHDGVLQVLSRQRIEGAHLWTADVSRRPPCRD